MKTFIIKAVALLSMILIGLMAYQGYRIKLNKEWIKVYNTRGSFRAWTLYYGYLRIQQRGELVVINWLKPSFIKTKRPYHQ